MAGSTTRWIGDMLGAAEVKRDKGKSGRPREEGERYACGKRKPQGERKLAEIAPALWQRIKTNAIRFGEDARLGSLVSRLSMLGHLSSIETAAAFRVAEIYGRYERVMGLRRSAKSAAYEIGHGDPGLSEERLDDAGLKALEERLTKVKDDFAQLQEWFKGSDIHALSLIEQLALEDQWLDATELEIVKAKLNWLAGRFGEKWRKKKPGPGKSERPRKGEAAAAATTPAAFVPAKPSADAASEIAFKMAVKELRPELDEDQLECAWQLHRSLRVAIADRERFRRDKEFRKLSPPPGAPPSGQGS